MITLSNRGFWAAVFRAFYPLSQKFWKHKEEWQIDPRYKTQTDLCTFVRTIFVSVPLAVLVWLLSAFLLLVAIFNFGRMLWLNASTVGIIMLIVFAFLILAVVVWGISAIGKKALSSETLNLAASYLKAKKSNFCPIVEMKDV